MPSISVLHQAESNAGRKGGYSGGVKKQVHDSDSIKMRARRDIPGYFGGQGWLGF